MLGSDASFHDARGSFEKSQRTGQVAQPFEGVPESAHAMGNVRMVLAESSLRDRHTLRVCVARRGRVSFKPQQVARDAERY